MEKDVDYLEDLGYLGDLERSLKHNSDYLLSLNLNERINLSAAIGIISEQVAKEFKYIFIENRGYISLVKNSDDSLEGLIKITNGALENLPYDQDKIIKLYNKYFPQERKIKQNFNFHNFDYS